MIFPKLIYTKKLMKNDFYQNIELFISDRKGISDYEILKKMKKSDNILSMS